MKKNLILALGLLLSAQAIACDICGCFMGITPYDNQSSIAFLHRYRVFNGYRLYQQPSHFFPTGAYKVAHGDTPTDVPKTYSTKDYESYKVYELRFKYFLHPRIEVNAIVPINANKSLDNGEKTSHVGLGDPTFFAGYHLIRRIDVEGMQQRLIAGAGIKIPSGNYYVKAADGDRLPLMMQPGTGSVDYFVYANYVIGIKRFGVSTNLMYKFNGENYYNEYIANSTSAYMNVFYKFQLRNKLTLIPSVQAYYEYTKGIYIQGSLQDGTKMNGLLVGPGLDLFYKNIGLNMAFQWRGYEDTDPENLKSSGRMVVGLSYNFNQSKYLLRKRH